MGFLNNKPILSSKTEGFRPIALNEDNVHSIFNLCLATDYTPNEQVCKGFLFSVSAGFRPKYQTVFYFNRNRLLKYKKDICYLFGQLNNTWKSELRWITLGDTRVTYSGTNWTEDNACLMELLYLGGNDALELISPFWSEKYMKLFEAIDRDDHEAFMQLPLFEPLDSDRAVLNKDVLKPTLSPKDPAFPAWWEAHKGEWED